MINKFICYFLLSFISFKSQAIDFPKIIHFIWLGGAPHSQDELKVKNWIINNPDYQVYIWHSLTDLKNREKLGMIRSNENESFLKFTRNLQTSSQQVVDYFKQTFNYKNVQIKALEEFFELLQEENNSNDDKFLDEHSKNNLITSFYDEINIQSPPGAVNLAAASDIARILLLYYYGGIYFDFDVYSAADYELNIPANSLGFKIMGKCSSGINPVLNENNNNLLASVDHGTIITHIARSISHSYIKLHDESVGKIYSDDIVSKFYKELSGYIRQYYDQVEYYSGSVKLGYVESFAQQQGIDIGKITLLQKKKFADVFYQKTPLGLLSATNEKRRMTMEYSGPIVVKDGLLDGLILMQRSISESCHELIFPQKYVGPANSEEGSWSF